MGQPQHSKTWWTALARYAAAALPIPDITISFYDDIAECRGYLRYYDAAIRRLDMCNGG